MIENLSNIFNVPRDTILVIMVIGALIIALTVFLAFILTPRNVRRRQRLVGVGQLIGRRYRIGYELGRGMNAVTFQVEDGKSPGTPFVAKVLLTPEDDPRITRASFRRHIERFHREMAHLEKLQGSKFVVPVHDYNPNSIPPFFIMSRCDGSLEEELNNIPLPMQKILDILADVCQGLAEIHRHEIIHRDLKPGNILRYKDRWVLADFGMSLLGEEGRRVTAFDSLPGTIPYTAPEVMYYEPGAIKPRVDVFSLGVTLKVMLTGVSTLENPTSSFLQARVPQATKDEVRLFDSLIANMTQFRAEDRPQTISAVAKSLEEIFKKINQMRVKENRPRLKGIKRIKEISF